MSILPKNENQETVDTPQNFFIYGATMSGKSYMSGEFPNPLFLNTDGNAKANPFPSIQLRNKKTINQKTGVVEFETDVINQLDQILLELQTTDHGFETIVLDVIDDIVVLIEQVITTNAGVQSLGDIGYGKGYSAFNDIFQQLVMDLKSIPLNVIYVSRINSFEDENGVLHENPSLKEKHVNIVNGNCDLMIMTKKVGKNYVRTIKAKRKNYDRDNIDDDRILKILDTIPGMFERKKADPTPKTKAEEPTPEPTKEEQMENMQEYIEEDKQVVAEEKAKKQEDIPDDAVVKQRKKPQI